MPTWPELNPATDAPTWTVLHLTSQMLGKVRVANAPWANHGWHVTLHPRADGLQTAPTAHGGRNFTLLLDLCRHAIGLTVSDGAHDSVPLQGKTIAEIHAGLLAMLKRHGLPADFHGRPNEIADAQPFAKDQAVRPYEPKAARRLLGALAIVVPIFEHFRAGFVGKASPVHFFWGSFDLAVTRFSGRTAPDHPGGIPGLPDRVTREAYSHEVSSAGFWPGGVTGAEPIFYSYAYPSPDGFAETSVTHGRYDDALGEFVLPYAEVRSAPDPAAMLQTFLQETYEAAANLASWERSVLERDVAAP